MKPNDPKSGSLQEFVKHYQVCWEGWPAYLMVGGKERQVGFELELSGTSEIGTNHLGPVRPACRHVYSALHATADWIYPKEERPSLYGIGPYETALRYSKVRSNRPDSHLKHQDPRGAGHSSIPGLGRIRLIAEAWNPAASISSP